MNTNGYGLCNKKYRWGTLKGLFICYVNQPSSCTDLVDSGTNKGKQMSGEACKDVNAGKTYFIFLLFTLFYTMN